MSISYWQRGQRIFKKSPPPLKPDAQEPGGEIDRCADHHGKREDEQGHPRRHLRSLFLDDDEKIREAGDEESDRDEAHDHLEMGQKPSARHVEKPRPPRIPPSN